MSHTEFKDLETAQQVELLYRNAAYISKRKEGTSILVLYQLDGFYVEIQYLKYRYYIARINVFASVDQLDPYLQAMDVEELMNC